MLNLVESDLGQTELISYLSNYRSGQFLTIS